MECLEDLIEREREDENCVEKEEQQESKSYLCSRFFHAKVVWYTLVGVGWLVSWFNSQSVGKI